MKVYSYLFIFVVLSLPSLCYGPDVATHMYVGWQTFDLWQDFDPDFYNVLTRECEIGTDAYDTTILAQKWYLIGLTLPDLFTKEGMSWVQAIIEAFKNPPDGLEFCRALNISDNTYNLTRVKFTYDTTNPEPNQALHKLWDMAVYARERTDWSPYERALIYGALMHTIQDIYGHMVCQPSIWGYGRTVECDSAINEYLLRFGEIIHEAFYTATYIEDWDFIKPLYMGLYPTELLPGWPPRFKLHFDPDHYFEHRFEFIMADTGDAPPFSYYVSFQDFDLNTEFERYVLPIQRFIESAEATGYSIGNLTFERLKAYLHGWAIYLFFLYGYYDHYSCIGGIYAHPDWTTFDIADFWSNMVINYVNSPDGFWSWFREIPFLGDVIDDIMEQYIRQKIYEFLKAYLAADINMAWRNALIDPVYWSMVWASVPVDSFELYWDMYRAIEYYNKLSTAKRPNFRTTYSNEIDHMVGLKEEYRANLINGPNYVWDKIQEKEIWSIARKAGLLGGMFDVSEDQEYYEQPGIFEMHFEKDGTPVYTPQDIELDIPSCIELKYDIVTLGPTCVKLMGISEEGSEEVVDMKIYDDQYQRHCESISIEGRDAISSYVELAYEVQTRGKRDQNLWQKMLSSNYREAYNDVVEDINRDIPGEHPDTVYKAWFKHGDPTRTADENPFTEPKLYWPYTLPISPSLTVLATPSDFIATPTTLTHITLTWQDNSSYEDGYILQEQHASSDWQVLDTLEANTESYTHYVSRYTDHWYRLYGYNSTYDVYSDTVYTWATTSPILAESGVLAGRDNIIRLNDVLYAIWSRPEEKKVFTSYSTDNGLNWSSPSEHGLPPVNDPYVGQIIVWSTNSETIGVATTSECDTTQQSYPWDVFVGYTTHNSDDVVGDYYEISTIDYNYNTPAAAIYDDKLGKHFVIFGVFRHDSVKGETQQWELYSMEVSHDFTDITSQVIAQGGGWPVFDPLRITCGKVKDTITIIVEGYKVCRGQTLEDSVVAWKYNGNSWVKRTAPLPKGRHYYLTKGGKLIYISDGIEIRFTQLTPSGYTTPEIVHVANDTLNCYPVLAEKDGVKLVVWQENGELYYSYKIYSSWSSPKQLTLSYTSSESPSIVIRKYVSDYASAGSISPTGIGIMAPPPPSISTYYYLECLYRDGCGILYKEKHFLTLPSFGGGLTGTELLPTILYDITPSILTDGILPIRYSLSNNSKVKFTIYDVMGRIVKTLELSNNPGHYTLNLNIGSLSSDLYFITMETPNYRATKKFSVIR